MPARRRRLIGGLRPLGRAALAAAPVALAALRLQPRAYLLLAAGARPAELPHQLRGGRLRLAAQRRGAGAAPPKPEAASWEERMQSRAKRGSFVGGKWVPDGDTDEAAVGDDGSSPQTARAPRSGGAPTAERGAGGRKAAKSSTRRQGKGGGKAKATQGKNVAAARAAAPAPAAELPEEPEGAVMWLPELFQTLLTLAVWLPVEFPGDAPGISIFAQPDWLAHWFDGPLLATTLLGALVSWIGWGIQSKSRKDLGPDEGMAGPLAQAGLYGGVRHPMYLGYVVTVAGPCIVTLSPARALVAAALAAALLVKIGREEALLARRHGDEWRSYCRTVPNKLVPFIL